MEGMLGMHQEHELKSYLHNKNIETMALQVHVNDKLPLRWLVLQML